MTVVVAARNAQATLPACLASLRALDYPDFTVTVVNDGSTDDTAAIARAAGVHVMEGPGRGAGAARNLAIEATTAEVVAFTDADCTVPPHWLRALTQGLHTPGVAGAGGKQRNVFPAGKHDEASHFDAFFRVASVISAYTRSGERARLVDHVASCNSAYWRAAILEVGGFILDFWPGEDVELDYRLKQRGYRCAYVPDAEVAHYRPGTLAWFREMMRRYGKNEHDLANRHGRFRPIHYVPIAAVTGAALQVLWLVPGLRWVIAALDAAAMAFAAIVLVRAAPPSAWPWVLLYAATAVGEWLRGWFSFRPSKPLKVG